MTGIGGDAHSLAQFGRQRRLAVSAGLRAVQQRHRNGPHRRRRTPTVTRPAALTWSLSGVTQPRPPRAQSNLTGRSRSPANVPDRVEEKQ